MALSRTELQAADERVTEPRLRPRILPPVPVPVVLCQCVTTLPHLLGFWRSSFSFGATLIPSPLMCNMHPFSVHLRSGHRRLCDIVEGVCISLEMAQLGYFLRSTPMTYSDIGLKAPRSASVSLCALLLFHYCYLCSAVPPCEVLPVEHHEV